MSKLPYVQVLRALAALAVAMLHAQHDAKELASHLGLSFGSWDRWPWAAGVDVFFVISGFIMVHSSRQLFARPEARREFLARRIARIVPLYWAVTTLYLIVALAAPSVLNGGYLGFWPVLASYLFIPTERPDGLVQPLYSLGWSLNYEMFFYALFALAITRPRRQAVFVLIVVLMALVLARCLVSLPQPLAFWAEPIVLEFAFGMALGLVRTEGVVLGRPARTLLALSGLLLLAADFTQEGGAVALPRAFAHGIPALLLVAAAALGRDRPQNAGWPTRAAVAVGDASYALYLVHPFVIRLGLKTAERSGLGALLGPWGFVAAALAVALLVALLVYRWFERPMTEQARALMEPVRSPQWSSP